MIKRIFDILCATVALALLSPLLLALAVMIKLGSRGPILYRGSRVGRGGRTFSILKFRTMVVNADQIGASSTAGDDPRITPVGHFLRRYKLDELPQFLNVLVGQMSVVGPRPQVAWAVDLYTPEQRDILTVRPGITDYASIRFSNEAEILRNSSDPDRDYMEKIHPEKTRLALEYVHHRSFAMDCDILRLTCKTLLFGRKSMATAPSTNKEIST